MFSALVDRDFIANLVRLAGESARADGATLYVLDPDRAFSQAVHCSQTPAILHQRYRNGCGWNPVLRTRRSAQETMDRKGHAFRPTVPGRRSGGEGFRHTGGILSSGYRAQYSSGLACVPLPATAHTDKNRD
jgi:hypothetical protein